jgi:filamentous hemagglutinin family protein
MSFRQQHLTLLLVGSCLVGVACNQSVFAQSITPAVDGTGTVVNRNGDRINIQGGTLSEDEANLFHSFEQFGLSAGEVANFLSDPQTRNILGRVIGGDASIIDGLIRVTGSNANLYLMNPAGILFGSNARLDVPASFLATTADGISLGDYWFSAVGTNNYSMLVGDPNAFAFTSSQPGPILNAGNLSLTEGHDLTLLGGTVINTGTLSAPGGSITVAAIPGENRVRISQEGMLLSLELETMATQDSSINGQAPNSLPFTPLSLPELLTGGDSPSIPSVTVNPDGTVQLTGSGITVPAEAGDAIASGTLNTSPTFPTSTSQSASPEINVLGDRVALLDVTLNASSANGGGTIRIGGDYQGQGTVFNASRTFVSSDSTISANAVERGNGGRIIVWADNTTGFYGSASARGGNQSGNGGFLEISGAENLTFQGIADTGATFGTSGTILFDPRDIYIVNTVDTVDPQDSSISATALGNSTGDIILDATRDINLNTSLNFIDDPGTIITFSASRNFNGANNTISAPGRNIEISAAAVTVGNIDTRTNTIDAGDISITATTGNVNTGLLLTSSQVPDTGTSGNGGNISINALNGSIMTGEIYTNSSSQNGTSRNGGNITIDAPNGSVMTGTLFSRSDALGDLGGNSGNGGSITVRSNTSNGTINTTTVANVVGVIQSESFSESGTTGDGGDIQLEGATIITSGLATARSRNPRIEEGIISTGGRITLTASREIRPSGGLTSFATNNDNIEIDGSVVLGTGSLEVGTEGAGNIVINGTIDGSQPIVINGGVSGIVQLDGSIGQTTPVTSITFGNNTANVEISGGITLVENTPQIYNVPITLIGDSVFGNAATPNVTFNNTLSLGNNNLTITAREIDFTGGSNSVTGTGRVLLQPATPAQDIQIGGSADTGSLDLTTTDIAALQDGFSSITIGRTTGSGEITLLSNTTFSDPIRLRATGGSGSINTSGFTLAGIDDASFTLLANQDIITDNIITSGQGIRLTSNNGRIDTRAGVLNSSSLTNNGGTIVLTAADDILTGTLFSRTGSPGINGSTQDGGAIFINAGSNIITSGNIDASSYGTGEGGDIRFASRGLIDTRLSNVRSTSLNRGGAITFTATGDITTGGANERASTGVLSFAGSPNGTGGNITFISRAGSIDTTRGWIDSGFRGNAGAIAFSALGDINTAILSADSSDGDGNNITLTSRAGSINTSTGFGFVSSFGSGDGGDIIMNAAGNITTGDGYADFSLFPIDGLDSRSRGSGSGGDIRLSSNNGDIDTSAGTLNSSSVGDRGGEVTLTATSGEILTGDLDSSGVSGGNVFFNAETAITARQINASGRFDDGGDVTLDPIGDVEVNSINAQGGNNGRGGDVNIVAGRFFRAIGLFRDRNNVLASISTAGGLGGGDITIRHGGQGLTPFNVGNLNENGTAEAITSGGSTILPPQSFPFSIQEGNIQIISVESPPPPPPPPPTEPPPTEPNVPDESRYGPSPSSNSPTDDLIYDPLPLPIAPPGFPEDRFSREVANHLNIPFGDDQTQSLSDAQQALLAVEQATGIKPAILYAFFIPGDPTSSGIPAEQSESTQSQSAEPENIWQFASNELSADTFAQDQIDQSENQRRDDDRLVLVLVTTSAQPVQKLVSITRAEVERVAGQFRDRIRVDNSLPEDYLNPSQQLYRWLITPIQSDLEEQGIENLVFIPDIKLRSIPFAALHDGESYLMQKYSIGLMPSLSLTDTRYADVRDARMLAMGASEFQELPPLPAVPLELSTIVDEWGGTVIDEEDFTPSNLTNEREQRPFGIVHLATHGRFEPGVAANSYIQFSDQRISLDQVPQLQLNSSPPVELLVLSACETALGDEKAELGFAGIAAKAGVKSVLAGLWNVSDVGTLALMTGFYRQLQIAPIKAEALRQSQLAMLEGTARFENGELRFPSGEAIPLPQDLATRETPELTHPFYWSGFTLIGNPW